MSEDVKVNPVDLYVSATFTDQYAEELQTACKAANTTAQASQSGWVGTSSRALGTLVSNWEDTTTKLHQTLTEHAANLRTSGHQYSATDENTSNKIQSSSQTPQAPRPSLNLD